MNLLDFKNNPLFLQGWRERNRPSGVISAITLVTIVIVLILVNAFLNETYIYHYEPNGASYKTNKVLLPWFKKSLLDMTVLQGYILLLFGCVNAYKMASRERSSGTIDFHRTSPTLRRNQIAGIIIGSTSLEWWVFLSIFAVEFFLSLVMNISTLAVLQFNLQLAICGILYQSIFTLIGISRDPLKNKAGAFGILVGVYIIGHILVANKMSFLHHLTWMPAYHQLDIHIKGAEFSDHWGHYRRHYKELLNMFYGVKLHPLFFQSIIQIPFIALFVSGIGRRFNNLEQPIFSKTQTLLASFYTLILFTGSFTSIQMSGVDKHYSSHANIYFLLYFILFMGIFGAMLATPTYLGYVRGLRRAKKQNIKRINSADNASSNVMWLGVYSFIVILTMAFYYNFFNIDIVKGCLGTAVLLSYIIFLGSFLEFFQLSKHHNKKSIAFTIIIIVWVLIPVLGLVMKTVIRDSFAYVFLLAPSPFFGSLEPIAKLFGRYGPSYSKYMGSMGIALAVSLTMAVVASFLAYRARARLNKSN